MKGLLKSVAGLLTSTNRKVSIFALFIVGLLLSAQASAAGLAIVAQDGTTGDVTFTPDVLVTPIITAIITTIASVAVIFLIVIGCRWVFRLARGGA